MNNRFIIGWLAVLVLLLGATCLYQHNLIDRQAAVIRNQTPVLGGAK